MDKKSEKLPSGNKRKKKSDIDKTATNDASPRGKKRKDSEKKTGESCSLWLHQMAKRIAKRRADEAAEYERNQGLSHKEVNVAAPNIIKSVVKTVSSMLPISLTKISKKSEEVITQPGPSGEMQVNQLGVISEGTKSSPAVQQRQIIQDQEIKSFGWTEKNKQRTNQMVTDLTKLAIELQPVDKVWIPERIDAATEVYAQEDLIPPPQNLYSDRESIDKEMLETFTRGSTESVFLDANPDFKVPKMPVMDSEHFLNEINKSRKRKTETQNRDVAINTAKTNDIAGEIAKHVDTLKKISLIAEEFNQRTAKNLKDIIESVQDDLLKKLSEIETEELAAGLSSPQEVRH